ncbi:hypothetical protein [Nonomuraea sp. SBT364]|uniref:hypothetical protein n=1 Tax=Nonomuraea sp. SBT364 TaxID=1580530 RepID=UPI00066E9E19|nr:hypothetical protein [Nonomuraea sp. SBT364]
MADHGFTVRVPETWYEFDVWRAGRTADLARAVDARIAASPALRPHRPTLLKLLREVAGLAARHGAVYGAAMTDHEEGGDTVMATLLAFHTGGHPDPAGNTVEAIASGVVAVAPREDSPDWREVRVADLPAGRAVRVSGVEHGAVVMHTLVPTPDGSGVLDLVLSSPHPGLAEPMLDLFDAISATLAWSDQKRTRGE